jgi:chaperone modulatory protein CbpM
MNRTGMLTPLTGVVLEEQIELSVGDLSAACRVQVGRIVALVEEGVVEPGFGAPDAPEDWRFAGEALARLRRALRLQRDFDLDPAATALVLGLFEQIDALKAALRER